MKREKYKCWRVESSKHYLVVGWCGLLARSCQAETGSYIFTFCITGKGHQKSEDILKLGKIPKDISVNLF